MNHEQNEILGMFFYKKRKFILVAYVQANLFNSFNTNQRIHSNTYGE